MTVEPHNLPLTIRRAYDQARAGDLRGAAGLCRSVLSEEPSHPEALLLHAVIALRTGEPAEALIAGRRALARHPARAAIHALIGDALLQLDQPLESLENYQSALQLDPALGSARFGRGKALVASKRYLEALVHVDEWLVSQPHDVEALLLRGRAQFELKDLNGALDTYSRAATLDPRSADALCNRGAVLTLLLRPTEAIVSFDAALRLAPDFAEAHHHRGQALRLDGRAEEALVAFERALSARANFPDALVGRGEVLRDLKRPTDALKSFELARALDAQSVAAHRGIGDALLDLGRAAEALTAHEKALLYPSQRAQSLVSRGTSLRALGRNAQAIADFDESLTLDSRNASTLCERAHTALVSGDDAAAVTFYTRALDMNPDIPFVPGTLRHIQMRLCDWSSSARAADPEQILRSVRSGIAACAPFAFLAMSDDPAAQLECSRAMSRHERMNRWGERPRTRYGHTRVRIAYLSADLRDHAVSYLMAGVFEHHDRNRFELTAVSLTPREHSTTGARVSAAFERFIDASAMNDRELVNQLRRQEIDIAVDLTGYTKGYRPPVLAAGVAPIQVSYLGFPGTMGGPQVDYLIADDFVVPVNLQQHYAEAIAYLPECFQANDDKRVIDARRFSRAEQGLPEQGLILCSLNNSYKINPGMFDVWMRLLQRVSDATLWLLNQSEGVRSNLSREAAIRGIDPGRLVFADRLPYPEHLARLRLADLFLDTVPFNAGTTASDLLWAGVPVLTCAGNAYASRMAGSLLRAVGLPELVTTSLPQYEAVALQLCTTPSLLSGYRERLEANRHSSPLFNTPRTTAYLEAAYLTMWERHERGEPPATFTASKILP